MKRTKWKDEYLFLYGTTTEDKICSRSTKCTRTANGAPGTNTVGVNVGTNWRGPTVSLAAFGPYRSNECVATFSRLRNQVPPPFFVCKCKPESAQRGARGRCIPVTPTSQLPRIHILSTTHPRCICHTSRPNCVPVTSSSYLRIVFTYHIRKPYSFYISITFT